MSDGNHAQNICQLWPLRCPHGYLTSFWLLDALLGCWGILATRRPFTVCPSPWPLDVLLAASVTNTWRPMMSHGNPPVPGTISPLSVLFISCRMRMLRWYLSWSWEVKLEKWTFVVSSGSHLVIKRDVAKLYIIYECWELCYWSKKGLNTWNKRAPG